MSDEVILHREEIENLPNSWVYTTIGEITEVIEKILPAETPDQEFYYLDISSIDNTQNKVIEPKVYLGHEAPSRARQLVRAHDVLFSTVRVYLRNIAQVPEQFDGHIASTGFSILRGRNGIHPKYLYYYSLNSEFIQRLEKLQRGTSYPAIRDSDMREQLIPLAPLNEQKRIVDEIETQFTRLDAGIAALKRLKANLKRYKASVLKAACEGTLVPQNPDDEPASELLERILQERRAQWEADQLSKYETQGKTPPKGWQSKYQEPAEPDTDDLPELPEGWVWVSLDQIGGLARGKSKHRPRNAKFLFGGPYPFVQTGEIRDANGILRTYVNTYSEEGLKQSRLWSAGTLCITIAANIADTAILGFDACFPDSVVGFLPLDESCDIRFIEYFIRTAKEDLERYAPATAQKNINLTTLQNLGIAYPPLEEQRRIANEVERYLSIAEEITKATQDGIRRAEHLRQSILKEAFAGRIVPQDPSAEPASELLARIQAERRAK